MSTPEQPDPTPAEQEAPPERREEEDAQRGPGHENAERAREPEE
ncbi:MAG: hypothetical protein ACRDOS_14270 [Gaiellaceae bacterium]